MGASHGTTAESKCFIVYKDNGTWRDGKCSIAALRNIKASCEESCGLLVWWNK